MKDGTRLYVNLTNRCNTTCPFCCMYSGEDKGTFMGFDTFRGIIDGCEGTFELQLEGGEPLLHPKLRLFVEYALSTTRCSKLLVLTNGIELDKHLKWLTDACHWHNVPIEIKVSVNYWLIGTRPDFVRHIANMCFAVEFTKDVTMTLNVRKRISGDDHIDNLLEEYGLTDKSNVFYLQSYGRLSNDGNYGKPVIVQNIANWRIYACDGTCFGQDLIARSEHERLLP